MPYREISLKFNKLSGKCSNETDLYIQEGSYKGDWRAPPGIPDNITSTRCIGRYHCGSASCLVSVVRRQICIFRKVRTSGVESSPKQPLQYYTNKPYREISLKFKKLSGKCSTETDLYFQEVSYKWS